MAKKKEHLDIVNISEKIAEGVDIAEKKIIDNIQLDINKFKGMSDDFTASSSISRTLGTIEDAINTRIEQIRSDITNKILNKGDNRAIIEEIDRSGVKRSESPMWKDIQREYKQLLSQNKVIKHLKEQKGHLQKMQTYSDNIIHQLQETEAKTRAMKGVVDRKQGTGNKIAYGGEHFGPSIADETLTSGIERGVKGTAKETAKKTKHNESKNKKNTEKISSYTNNVNIPDSNAEMTKEAYVVLARQHEELLSKRMKVAEKIKEARGHGDLSENAEYDAAKAESAELEDIINRSEKALNTGRIAKENSSIGKTYTYKQGEKTYKVALGSSAEKSVIADEGIEVASLNSDLGQVLKNASIGKRMFRGEEIEITDISPTPMKEIGEIKENIQRKLQERMSEKVPITIDDIFSKITQRSATETLLNEAIKKKDKGKQALYTEQKGNQDKEINEMLTGYYEQIGETFTSDTQKHLNKEFSTILKNEKIPKNVKRQAVENLLDEVIKEKDIKSKQANFTSEGIGVERKFRSSFIAPNDNTVAIPSGETVKIFHPNLENIKDVAIGEKTYKTANGLTLSTLSQVYEDIEHTIQNIQGKYIGQEIPEFEKENISHFENQKKDIVSAIGESYNYALKNAPDLADIIQNQVYRTNGEEFEHLRSLYYDDDKNYANQDLLRKELRKKEIIEPRSDWTEIVDDTETTGNATWQKKENEENEKRNELKESIREVETGQRHGFFSRDEFLANQLTEKQIEQDNPLSKADMQKFVGTGHNLSRLYSFKQSIDHVAKKYAKNTGLNIDDILQQMFDLNPEMQKQYETSALFRSKFEEYKGFSTKSGVTFNNFTKALRDINSLENVDPMIKTLANFMSTIESGHSIGTRAQMEQIFVKQAGNKKFNKDYFEENKSDELFRNINLPEDMEYRDKSLSANLFNRPNREDYSLKSRKERWIESYEGKEILAPYGVLDNVIQKDGIYDISPINQAIETAEKMLTETTNEQHLSQIKKDIKSLQSWKQRIIESQLQSVSQNLEQSENTIKSSQKQYVKSNKKLKYIYDDDINKEILAPYSPAEKQKQVDKRIQNATEIMNKYKGTSLAGLRTFAKNYSTRMGKANIPDLIQKRYLSADDDLAKFEDMMIRSLHYYGDNPDRIAQEIKYRQKEYGESERIAKHMVENSQRQIEEAYDKHITPIFQKNIESDDINEKVDEKLIENIKEDKKKESSKKKKKSTKKSKESTTTEEKIKPIIDNISENNITQTSIVPTQTALGTEQEALGNFGPAVQSHVDEIGKAIDIEEQKIAVSERLVTQLGVEKKALEETLGLAGQTVRIGENAGFVTGVNSQSNGDEIAQNINNGLIASMNNSGQFFKDYQAELLLQTAKDALTMKGKGSDIFTENVVMEKIGSNAFLDEKDHKYYYTDSKGRKIKLEDEISASQFYSAGRIGAKEWIDSPEVMSMKALVSELFSKGYVNVRYDDADGKTQNSIATNFDQLSELTGRDFGEIGYNEASQIIGNTVHKMLELTTKYGVSNVSELTGNAKKEWDTFFETNNKKYEQIYGSRATGNKTLMNVASGKADDIKDLYNIVAQKMGIDLLNVNKLTETALVGQYVDYTTGARQNAAGTFDVIFGNILGDIKTTGGIRDSVAAQFQMLTDLIRVNSDEIASKMGIENSTQSIEAFINSLRSVVFQVGKDGTAIAAQIEGISEQQKAALLTGVNYNRMIAEQNPQASGSAVSEALAFKFGYKKQVEFSEDNKALYKRFEELRRDRATMGEFEALAQELGFTTKNISKKGNDRTYAWERIDEKTGKILHVGATFNENGGMLPHGNSISYRESDASEANTVKGQYIDLLRQELNLEQQIETLQVKRQAAIVNGNTQEAVDLETQIKNQEALLDLLRKQKKDTRFVEDNNENASMKKEVEDDYRESFEGKEIQYKGEAERQKIARKATNSLEKNYEDALKAEKKAELRLKQLKNSTGSETEQKLTEKIKNLRKRKKTASPEEKANIEEELKQATNDIAQIRNLNIEKLEAEANLKKARKDRKAIEKDNVDKSDTLKAVKKDFDKTSGKEMEQDFHFKQDKKNVDELDSLITQRAEAYKKMLVHHNNAETTLEQAAAFDLAKIEEKIKSFIQDNIKKEDRESAKKYSDSEFESKKEKIDDEETNRIQAKTEATNKQIAQNELLEQQKQKQQLLAQKSKMIEEQKKLLPISDAYQKKQGEIDEINSQIKGIESYTWDANKRQIFQNGQLVATLSQEEAIKFQQKYNSELFKTQQMQHEVDKASQKKGFFGSIKDSVSSTLQYMMVWQAGYMIIGKVRQALQTVINTTKELDKTMTNLQIVTGKTKEETYEMMKNYSSLAQELGGTIGEVSASANEWLRMGYDTAEVNTLITDTMMLSKLGMIDTTKATEYLTSAIKGYGVAVKDASEIVDMATALDMKYAVSSGYILEAMSKTAASAKLAKVEMSDLQSMIAIAGEVTQKDASVIGESFKTAFARYGNVKASAFVGNSDLIGLKDTYAYENNISENSESMSGVNDIEKVLNKVHINLREKDMVTWRSYSDILKDIGEGWKTYSDYEKNAITTALFGTRQRENGLVVLENYSRVLQAQEIAVSSVGTAAKKYEAYQNSLEASTKKVSAAVEDLILKLQANGALKDLSDSIVWLIKNLKIIAPLMLTAFAVGHLDSFILKLNKISFLINSKMLALRNFDIKGLFSGTAQKISMGVDSSRNYFETEQLKVLETKKQLTTTQLMTIEFEKMYNILRGMSYEEAEQLALERKKTLEGEKQVSSETRETIENQAQEEFEFMQTENDAVQATSETSQTANDQIQAYLEGNSTTQEFLQLKGEEGQTVQDFLQLKGEQGQSLEDLKQLNSETLQSIQDKLQLSNEEMQTLLGMKFGRNQNLGNLVLNSQGKLTPLNSFMKASGYLMGAMGGWSAGTNVAEGKGVKSTAGKIGWGVAGTAAGIGLTAAGAKIGATIGTAISPALGTAIGAAAGGAIAMLGGKIAEWWNKGIQERLQALKDELASLEELYSKASSSDTSMNIERYDELAKGVNNLGQNISLTNSEYEEFLNLGNELGQMFPELVSHTDRFGNSLLGADGRVGGLREQLSLLLTDLQEDVDTKLLNPELAKEEFKNAKTNVKQSSKSDNIHYDTWKMLANKDGLYGYLSKHGITNDILQKAGVYKYNVENSSWAAEFDAVGSTQDIFAYSELDEESKEKLKLYAEKQLKNIPEKQNIASTQFTSQYLPAIMRESWDYSTLDQNLQEFTNRMAQGLDISKFKNFDDWKTFIEEKIVQPLKDSKRELTPILEELYKFDFEGSNKNMSEDMKIFDDYLNDIIEFYSNKPDIYKEIKSKMGISTNSDGIMTNSFGVEVTDKDIISDFLGIENIASAVMENLRNKFVENPQVADILSQNFTTTELKSLNELSSDKIRNIMGDGGVEDRVKNIETYLKNNNLISLQSVTSGLTKSLMADIKEGNEDAKTLKNILETEAWDINPENFDINKFSNLSPDTKNKLQDLIDKAKKLGVTVGEAYNNVKDLMSLNKYNETTLSVESITSRYDKLKDIASEMRENKIISAENFDIISDNYPELIEYLGDPDEFINQVNNVLENKSDLIKGSIKNDLSNNDKYFEKLAEKYAIDYQIYKTYSQLRKDIEKYGDIDFSKPEGLEQLKTRITSEIQEAGELDLSKSFEENWVDFSGVELEAGETAQDAYMRFITAFASAIPVHLKIDVDINALSNQIEKQIKSKSIDDINAGYRDLLDSIESYNDAKRSKKHAEDDWGEAQEDWEEAQEDWARAQEDWARAQKDYEKQKRRLEKAARDQQKKEQLQELTDMLERRNLIIEQYDKKISNTKEAVNLLDSSDYEGKYNNLNSQYVLNETQISNLKNDLAALSSITPTSADQASKLAEEYDKLSSSLMEAELNAYQLKQEMLQMGLDAFSSCLENINNQFERQDSILTDMLDVLEADTGLLSAWELVDLNEFTNIDKDDIVDNRTDYDTMLKSQEAYQNTSLAMHRQYLDLLKTENAEENAIFWEDHADNIADNERQLRDAEEAFHDAEEALSDARRSFDYAKEDWEESKKDWENAVTDYYESINNFIKEYGGPLSELGIDVNNLFGDQLLKDADNWMNARAIITEEGRLIEDAVRKLGGNYVPNDPNFNSDDDTGYSPQDVVYSPETESDITEAQVYDSFNEFTERTKDFWEGNFDNISKYVPQNKPSNNSNIVKGTWSYNGTTRQREFIPDENGKDYAEKYYDSSARVYKYKNTSNINTQTTSTSTNTNTTKTSDVNNKQSSTTKIIIPAPELDPKWTDGSKEQEIIDKFSTIISNVKSSIETNPNLKLSLNDIWDFSESTENPDFVGPVLPEDEEKNQIKSPFEKLLKTVSEDIKKLNIQIQEDLQKVIDDCSIPVPKLSKEWTDAPHKKGSLSSDIVDATEKSVNDAIWQLKKDYKSKENLQIPSPKLLEDDWSGSDENSLRSRICDKLKEIYTSINENEAKDFVLAAPKPNEESWTTFGEEIAEYISNGINNAIVEGTIVQVNTDTPPSEFQGGNVAGTTISNNSVKKGQTLYYDTGSVYGHVGIYDGNGGMYHLINGEVRYNKLDSLPKKWKFMASGWNGGVELTSDQVDKMFEQIQAGNNFGKGKDQCQGWVAKAYEYVLGRYLSDLSPKTIVANHPDWLTPNAIFNDNGGDNNLVLNNSLLSGLLKYMYSNFNTDVPSDLGWVSAKYESGGSADRISSGKGDHGGKSYGIPQFSSTQGSADAFVQFLKKEYPDIGNIFGNAKAGTDAFDAAWRIAAERHSSFGYIQQQYAKKVYVDPHIATIMKKYGLDMNRSRALQEAIFSAAIQYHNLAPSLLKGYKQGMTDTEIINLIYNNKLSGINSHFKSSSDEVRAGVRNRIYKEWKDVLNIAEYATGTTSGGHQGGPAIVGEGKNSEIVDMPNKTPFIVSDATLFTDMPKGTHVIPIPEYAEGTDSYRDFDSVIKSNPELYAKIYNEDGTMTELTRKILSELGYIVDDKDAIYDNNNVLQKTEDILNSSNFLDYIEKNLVDINNTAGDIEKAIITGNKKDIIEKAKNIYGENAEAVLKLSGVDGIREQDVEEQQYKLKDIDPDLKNNNIIDIILDSGRDPETIIEQDKFWMKIAEEKINENPELGITFNDWLENYETLKKDPNNPYYLTYLVDDLADGSNYISDNFKQNLLFAQKNIGEPLEKEKDRTVDYIESQKIGISESTFINDIRADMYKEQIPMLKGYYTDALNYITKLQEEGADSETINKAIEVAENIRTTMVEANTSYAQILDEQLTSEKGYSDIVKEQVDYQNELMQNAVDLGQVNKLDYEAIIRNNNRVIEASIESLSQIENRLRQEGIEKGWSEEKILESIANDPNVKELKKTINSTLLSNKDTANDRLEYNLNKINKNIEKIERGMPKKWDNKEQIRSYYASLPVEYDKEILELENYLRDTPNLSEEDREETFDRLNELYSKKHDAEINETEALVDYYDDVYDALQYRVDEYIDDLNLEKEAVSERYDEEIEKLTQVNEDKERSIKLSELQQKLDNAEKQKKRVYRAGVGFVYESDRSEIKNAKKELDDFWRQDKINDLNTAKDLEIKFYDERINGWNKYLKGVEKQFKRFEAAQNHDLLMRELGVDSLEELDKKLIEDRDNFLINYDSQNELYGNYNANYTGIFNTFLDEYEQLLIKLDKLNKTMLKPVVDNFYNYGSLLEVDANGNAPKNAQIGDRIKTSDGIYLIVPEGTEGAKYNDKTGHWSKKIDNYGYYKNLFSVDINGKAPHYATIGDYIQTSDGIYEIVSKGTEGANYNPETGRWSRKADNVFGLLLQSDSKGNAPNYARIGDRIQTGDGVYEIVYEGTPNAHYNKDTGKWSIKISGIEKEDAYIYDYVQDYDDVHTSDDMLLWKKFQKQFGINDIAGLLGDNEQLQKIVFETFNGEKITEEVIKGLQKNKSNYYDNIIDKHNVEDLIKFVKGIINPYLLDEQDYLQILVRKLNKDNWTNKDINELVESLDDSKLQSKISDLVLNAKKQFEEGVSANEISKNIESQVTNSAYFQYLDSETQERIKNLIWGISSWDISNDDIISKLTEVAKNICSAINNGIGKDNPEQNLPDYTNGFQKITAGEAYDKFGVEIEDGGSFSVGGTNYVVTESSNKSSTSGGTIATTKVIGGVTYGYDSTGRYVGVVGGSSGGSSRSSGASGKTNSSSSGKSSGSGTSSSSGGLTQTIGGVKFKCDSNGHITGFAKNGSDGTTTRSFLAGEEGTEIGVYPDGTVVLYGTNGPEIYENEPLGTTIFTAEESAKILGMYKNGTMNKGLNKYTGFSSMNSLDYYKYLNKNNSNMPEYFSTIPKYENTNKQKCGDTIYEIHTVELPNVENASTFWEELNNGVRRHIKDK